MTDYVFVGPSPTDERCAALGRTEDFQTLNILECQAYITALRRFYGQEPDGTRLFVKAQAHDFGTYREVACQYDPDNEAAQAYAYKLENGLATWAQAGMRAPVTYDEAEPTRAVTILRDSRMWWLGGAPPVPPRA